MLRVRVEILPYGDETKTREIGRLDIFNKKAVDGGYYEYGVIHSDDKEPIGMFTDTVYHFRSLGFWQLLEKVLSELVNSRDVPPPQPR